MSDADQAPTASPAPAPSESGPSERGRRRSRWRQRLILSSWVIVPGMAAVGWWAWRLRDHDALWALPGASLADIRAASPQADWGDAIRGDDVFAVLVTLILLGGWTVGRIRRRGTIGSRRTTAHEALALAASLGYLAADGIENALLRTVVEHLRDGQPTAVSAADALLLGRASGAKWGFLAVAALLVVALWHRPPPAVDRAAVTWKATPHGTPPSAGWEPDPQRLGISISGGGIRSASFAIGVLQELRRQGILGRARYVTSVSGGSYAAMALTSVNQDPPAQDPPGFAPGSPEEQRLRRSLRYLAANTRVMAGAIARIGLGLLINLLLIYWITFAVVRPMGWLIGTPLVQRGLRIEQPVVVDVLGEDDDPDPGTEQPYKRCQRDDPSGASPDDVPGLRIGDPYVVSGEPETTARPVDVTVPDQCVHVRHTDGRDLYVAVGLVQSRAGVVRIVDGVPTIDQQPRLELRHLSCRTGDRPPSPCPPGSAPSTAELREMLTVVSPALGIRDGTAGRADADALDGSVTVGRATVEPVSVIDRRQPLDIDRRHWVPPLVGLGLTVLCALRRVVGRPDRWEGWLKATTSFGLFTVAYGLVMLVLPWLADVLPRAVNHLAETAPSPGALEEVPWIPGGLPSLAVWPLLAGSAVHQFFSGRKKEAAPPAKRSRNTTAFLGKVLTVVRRTVVGIVLVVIVVGNALNILVVAAMNGPGQQLPWLSREALGHDLTQYLPSEDLALWALMTGLLVLTYGVSESTSWSPAPVYKRRLAWAFAWARNGDNAHHRDYGPSPAGDWAALAPPRPEDDTGDGTPPPVGATTAGSGSDRTGYLDGHHGDGTELVLCCAANVLGGDRGSRGSDAEDRAPTGRGAVSFSASRSHLGGPEVGWMDTADYVARLGRRRRWDVNIPGFTALSGAAVSPAMGKKELGPIGSVLAVLNVRLGAWLPHPRWVGAMTTDPGAPLPARRWDHNPGWPWFTREVTRRYRGDAPYLYVTDGGHWENLGLVEALRRGCTTVVAISSAGDGELSHATLAEAVEIARSDLGVEIELSEVWKARLPAGGTTAERLPSGRQYILEPDGEASVGRVAPQGFAYGKLRFRRPDGTVVEGAILLIEATMVDGLPVDVHAYAESHPEFPNVSTGDQFLTNRDFESYRVLGREITRSALGGVAGARFRHRVETCSRRAST